MLELVELEKLPEKQRRAILRRRIEKETAPAKFKRLALDAAKLGDLDLVQYAEEREKFWLTVEAMPKPPPFGRKICRSCSEVSFEVTEKCPTCGIINWWK